jgi:hypothetical protein
MFSEGSLAASPQTFRQRSSSARLIRIQLRLNHGLNRDHACEASKVGFGFEMCNEPAGVVEHTSQDDVDWICSDWHLYWSLSAPCACGNWKLHAYTDVYLKYVVFIVYPVFLEYQVCFGHIARMSEEKSKTVPVSIRVLPEVRDELLRIAKAEERTLSQIVAMMIDAELGRRPRKAWRRGK